MFSVLYSVLWLHISFLNNQRVNYWQQLSQNLNTRNIIFVFCLLILPFHINYYIFWRKSSSSWIKNNLEWQLGLHFMDGLAKSSHNICEYHKEPHCIDQNIYRTLLSWLFQCCCHGLHGWTQIAHGGKGVLMIVEWSHRMLISFPFLEGLSVCVFLLIAVDCWCS